MSIIQWNSLGILIRHRCSYFRATAKFPLPPVSTYLCHLWLVPRLLVLLTRDFTVNIDVNFRGAYIEEREREYRSCAGGNYSRELILAINTARDECRLCRGCITRTQHRGSGCNDWWCNYKLIAFENKQIWTFVVFRENWRLLRNLLRKQLHVRFVGHSHYW